MPSVLKTCWLLVNAQAYRVHSIPVNPMGRARHVMERVHLLLHLHLLHQVPEATTIIVVWALSKQILSAVQHVMEVQTKNVLLVHALLMPQIAPQFTKALLNRLHHPLKLRQIHRHDSQLRSQLHHQLKLRQKRQLLLHPRQFQPQLQRQIRQMLRQIK